ncbi:hypothetical protein K450DRAFT_229091 [Umbelopsis ramanniana AG]|uniref:Uncharacterized protein n=1 Tax=Umbelopsis ramanniana AG TaxID=1314678 RepID=A0AAD5EEZ3_UMBRA|nr:uncharacterized protein K450DRAFT_229091 [Umbelopsis ramanniana AG]KAI8582117.1 hypothetical protein K450DRAFT_229091 [Umbelopsis ramanniana AG]
MYTHYKPVFPCWCQMLTNGEGRCLFIEKSGGHVLFQRTSQQSCWWFLFPSLPLATVVFAIEIYRGRCRCCLMIFQFIAVSCYLVLIVVAFFPELDYIEYFVVDEKLFMPADFTYLAEGNWFFHYDGRIFHFHRELMITLFRQLDYKELLNFSYTLADIYYIILILKE